MTRLRHAVRPINHGPQPCGSPAALAEFAQTMTECGERFVVSRAELFERLARCGSPAEATTVTATWFQRRLSEVAEQNQRLFQAWLAMGMMGWPVATGSAAPTEAPAPQQPSPPQPPSHQSRDLAA